MCDRSAGLRRLVPPLRGAESADFERRSPPGRRRRHGEAGQLLDDDTREGRRGAHATAAVLVIRSPTRQDAGAADTRVNDGVDATACGAAGASAGAGRR